MVTIIVTIVCISGVLVLGLLMVICVWLGYMKELVTGMLYEYAIIITNLGITGLLVFWFSFWYMFKYIYLHIKNRYAGVA